MRTPGRPRIVRFDEAFENTRTFMHARAAELGGRSVVLRDLYGRISVIIDAEPGPQHPALAAELDKALGGYGPGVDEVFQFRSDLIVPEAIFKAEDALPLFEGRTDVLLLERQVIEQDWLRKPLRPETTPGPKRAVFFGIKGGVGRSTALAVMAWKLAQADKRVLIIDLDLESPGLSSTLLPQDRMPDFGVVDWLVEDAIGQADESLLDDMVQTSPLVENTAGEIRIVPAGGKKGDYLAKLSRAYMGGGEPDHYRDFAERLEGMVSALEAKERPDVVLIDSRAGLHDDAAAAVTRLGATAFLFAVGTAQTWQGYEILFKHWHRNPAIRELRQSLKIVSAMIPAEGRDEHEKEFLESSYGLFQRHLYDATPPGEPDAFNYDVRDESGPHFPLGIYWNLALQAFDPVRRPRAVPPDQVDLAYGGFVREAAALLAITLKR